MRTGSENRHPPADGSSSYCPPRTSGKCLRRLDFWQAAHISAIRGSNVSLTIASCSFFSAARLHRLNDTVDDIRAVADLSVSGRRLSPESHRSRMSISSAATEVVPISTARPQSGTSSSGAHRISSTSTFDARALRRITHCTSKLYFRSVSAIFFITTNGIFHVLCTGMTSSTAHVTRSRSGIVSSSVRACIVTRITSRSFSKAIPAAATSAFVFSKIAISFRRIQVRHLHPALIRRCNVRYHLPPHLR